MSVSNIVDWNDANASAGFIGDRDRLSQLAASLSSIPRNLQPIAASLRAQSAVDVVAGRAMKVLFWDARSSTIARLGVAMIHENLCDHAENHAALYRLWDNDLKKMTHRRQFCETAGLLCFLVAPFVWKQGVEIHWICVGLIVGAYLIINSVKLMIDESNTNYLMHHWDLQNTLEYLRRND